MKILILGGDSDSNLGDTAILAALCQCLSSARPDARLTVTGFSGRKLTLPGVTTLIAGGPARMGALMRVARQQQLIILGGGGLFQDDDSRIKMPYWGSKLAALRACNDNIVGHSLGAGPLSHPESRAFARLACGVMRSVSVRDEFARTALSPCTRRTIGIVPDPAFMLTPASAEDAIRILATTGLPAHRPIIGVALRRWFHRRGGFIPHRIRAWAGMDKRHGTAEMDELLDQVGRAVSSLARETGASVLLLPTYCVAHEGDDLVCERLIQRLPGVPAKVLRLNDPRLYKAVTGRLILMISARMHPLILASAMGTPIVGLAYNGKFDGLFDQLGTRSRMLWLNEALQGGMDARLVDLAHAALADRSALLERTRALAQIAADRTAALVDPAVNVLSASC
jgi:polysaccharide pyruvyl transferase WcaK-like protein